MTPPLPRPYRNGNGNGGPSWKLLAMALAGLVLTVGGGWVSLAQRALEEKVNTHAVLSEKRFEDHQAEDKDVREGMRQDIRDLREDMHNGQSDILNALGRRRSR